MQGVTGCGVVLGWERRVYVDVDVDWDVELRIQMTVTRSASIQYNSGALLNEIARVCVTIREVVLGPLLVHSPCWDERK